MQPVQSHSGVFELLLTLFSSGNSREALEKPFCSLFSEPAFVTKTLYEVEDFSQPSPVSQDHGGPEPCQFEPLAGEDGGHP